MAMKSTIDAVKSVCSLDPSINIAQVKAAIAELNGEGIRELQGETPSRSFSRAQVAALLGVNCRTVTNYAKRGLLVPIYSGASGKRAQSYTGMSVMALLSGRVSIRG